MRKDLFAIRDEVYADGTHSCEKFNKAGKEISISSISQEWIEKLTIDSNNQHRRIKANPGAAEVWLMERQNGAPWREKAERIQQIEDEKAKKELQQKKLSLMAKQVCTGLKSVYNAYFDPSELIPLLAEAVKESQKTKPNPNSMQLLKSVQRYDLKQVKRLLEVHDKAAPETPSLSITTRKPVRPR